LTRSPEPITTGTSPNTDLTQQERLELEKRQLEATLEQLRMHYSDRYPDVVRATHRLEEINAQLNSLPPDPVNRNPDASEKTSLTAVRLELIDKEMKRLAAEQNHIQSQIKSYQEKVDAAPIREEQLVELTRNYEISRQHYQALLDKSFNVNMAADLEEKQKAERFIVLDPAQIPEKPAKPNRKKLILLAGLVALGFSIFCVLVREELSPAVKTEMELKSLLPAGVRVWGFIPRIEVISDVRRERRLAICASLACILLSVALIRVIWQIHPLR
jgi:polysaccharide biosynthesis transport protein